MYWVQKGLLFFHLIGLGLYIGFHAVTYLLSARIQAAREAGEEGGAEELANSRMLFRVLVMAIWGLVLLLSSGLAMSILSGYGFFGTTWLTVKHVAFFAMILNTAHLLFIMRLLGRELSSVSGAGPRGGPRPGGAAKAVRSFQRGHDGDHHSFRGVSVLSAAPSGGSED